MKKKILSISLILVIILSLCPDIRAHADTGVAFYITHRHIGNEDVCGGCYTTPHYHVHSDPGSGDCYTPRYHVHSGSPSGGGCYTVPVLHEHIGDSSAAGGCYVPRYHSHDSGCYRRGECDWSRTLNNVGLTESWCHIHGDITQVEAEVIETHSSCGQGTITYSGASYCPSCGYQGTLGGGTHEYSILTCTKGTSYIEGYVLGCGHVEGDVDHYDPGCDLEGVIEGYDLTCTKTASYIDRYDPGCGMEDGENAIAVIVTQSPVSGGTHMQLTASLEDLSGGIIDISDASFSWKDIDGNDLGSGDELNVSTNGSYGLEVTLSDEGINEDSCRGSVTVSGIRAAGSGNGNNNDNNDNGEGNDSEEGGNPDDNSGSGTGQGEGTLSDDTDGTGAGYATPTPMPTPTATPAVTASGNSGDNDGSKTTSSGSRWRNDDDITDESSTGSGINAEGNAQAGAEDLQNRLPAVEKKKVEAPRADSDNEEELDNGQVKDDGKGQNGGFIGRAGTFLRTPTGRIITIGVTSALLIGAAFLLLLLLRTTVIVFNFDGQMKRHFAGIAFVHYKKDGYELEITDDICERAYTNRYEFFMGLFLIGRDSDTQILVIKQDHQTMAKAERMMRVTI
ncbi:MAG: hypothetical protein K5870_09775 [Lachnospiraceae bacterium]|nr:hypothetical protein [Lachnospiraceae bacterium]